MTHKDYYEILQVEPNANEAIIKKAYRALAKVYHPDKNRGNAYFNQKFREIAEAYKILSNEKERNIYNYHLHSKMEVVKEPFHYPTVNSLLTEVKKLRQMVATEDPDRMNRTGLYKEIERLLQLPDISFLKNNANEQEKEAFIDDILFCSRFFQFVKAQTIVQSLWPLAETQIEVVKLKKFETQVKYQSAWNRYKFAFVLFVVFMLCLLIYFVG